MSQLPDPIDPITLTDNEVAFYHQYGYLTLPNVIAPDTLEAVRSDVLEVLEKNGINVAGLSHASETADKLRQYSQYLKGSTLDQVINSPNVLTLASRLISGPALRYLPFTAVKAGGGGGQFHYHQDNNDTAHEPALGSINIWVALVDMSPDNGCLYIVPESNHDGTLQAENAGDGDTHRKVSVDPPNAIPIRLRAGDAVAFSRLTVHGSGPNITNEPRIAYALQYARRDVKIYQADTDTWLPLVDHPVFETDPIETWPVRTIS